MLCFLQFGIILLLCVIAMQGMETTMQNVTISDGAGSFLSYAHHCNGSFPNTSIFSREGHLKMVSALKIKGMLTAWLPLRRKNLTKWTWLSGEILGPAISNPDTVIPGHDCAVLWKRDGMIIDNPCNQQFRQYICSSGTPCCDPKENMELHCLEISKKMYRIYKGKVSWFQARQACHEKNSTLASFEKKNYQEIINSVKNTKEGVDKTWIGLRLTDYVYQIPGLYEWDINFYMWQSHGPCICPEKACAVFSIQNNTAKWKAEHCGSSHHFICGDIASSQVMTQITKDQYKGPILPTALVSAITVLLAIILVTIFGCRRFRKYKTGKIKYQGQRVEEGMPLQEHGSSDSSIQINTLNTEKEVTMLEEAKIFRKRIEEHTNLGTENKNILFVGLNGTGKSSLISSLITALTPGPYRAVAEPGSFGETGQAITWFLEAFPLLRTCNKERIEPNNQPVLWDCPGFLDDDSENTVNLLQDIIRGDFMLSTRIPDVASTATYEKAVEIIDTSETCSKMDLIIFVHDCQISVPEHLAAAVVKATRYSQNYKIPLLLVINKRDLFAEDPASLERVTIQVSKVLGLYNQVDRIFKLSCYFAGDKQEKIQRNAKIDSYMCNLWKELLCRFNYISSEET